MRTDAPRRADSGSLVRGISRYVVGVRRAVGPNIAGKIGPSGRAFRCAVAVRVIGGSGANRLHPRERGIRVTLAGPPRLRPCGPDFRADDRRASSKGRRPPPSGRRWRQAVVRTDEPSNPRASRAENRRPAAAIRGGATSVTRMW